MNREWIIPVSIIVLVMLACGYWFFKGFLNELLNRYAALRRDAELWRNGQKPIGKLVSSDWDGDGLKVTANITDEEVRRRIVGDDMTDYSIGPKINVPPKPEWETKTTWFDFDMDDALTMSIKDWDMFVKTVVQVWKNMLISDGYKLDTSITTHVGEGSSLNSVLGKQRVTLEVRCYKPDEVNWSRHTPPKGSRWVTPMECHGNDGFCTRCSPRNPNRKWVVRDA